MMSKATNNNSSLANAVQSKGADRRARNKGSHTTQARAKAQRAKRDAQTQTRQAQQAVETTQHKKTGRQELQARRRLIATLIEAYIQDHIGGNRSSKTVEWHQTALGLMHHFFEGKLDIKEIDEVEAEGISAWFAHLRATPGARGKLRSERTVYDFPSSSPGFLSSCLRCHR